MTQQSENSMHGIVSDVIAGSLITQRANKLGMDTEQLLNSSAPATTEIYAALTEFGLEFVERHVGTAGPLPAPAPDH